MSGQTLAYDDPGATGTPPPAPSAFTRLADWFTAIPTWILITLAATLAVVTLALLIAAAAIAVNRIRNRETSKRESWAADKAMTFLAAGVATAVTGTGMWAFFADTLGVRSLPLLVGLFAFFEIAMLAEALRSRLFRIRRAREESTNPTDSETRDVDVDGIAVWVLAIISGVLAATHETEFGAIALRLIAPVIAAWLWERGLVGELQQFRRRKPTKKIALRISLERVLVFLRIAEPTKRDVDDVDRSRRRAAYTVAAYRLHTRLTDKAPTTLARVARWRLRRAGLAIMTRYGVAELQRARGDVAALYGMEQSTAPGSVAGLAPWATGHGEVIAGSAVPAVDAVAGQAAIEAAPGPVETDLLDDWAEVVPETAVRPHPQSDSHLNGSHLAHDIRSGKLGGGSTRDSDSRNVDGKPAQQAGAIRAALTGQPAANTTAVSAGNTGANRTAPATANGAAKTSVKRPASTTAKPLDSFPELGDDARETVDRLARTFARYPKAKNRELAKRAGLTLATTNRYMARVRAEAAAREAEEANEQHPSAATGSNAETAVREANAPASLPPLAPLPAPAPLAVVAVNGHNHHSHTKTANDNH